jgi:hypothetical protein
MLVATLIMILLSVIGTLTIKNKFPSIEVDSSSLTYVSEGISIVATENSTVAIGKSPLHHLCSGEFNNSVLEVTEYYLNNNYVKSGDIIDTKEILETNGKLINSEWFAGLSKNNLIRLHSGTNDLGVSYYNKNVTIYWLLCFNGVNLKFTDAPTPSIAYRPVITRPSFVDNWVITTGIFLTMLVLLGNAYQLISKIWEK